MVWDPHFTKDIKSLEEVQKFDKLRVSSQLMQPACTTIYIERRKILKLCLLFIILTGRVIYPSLPFERTSIYPNRQYSAICTFR